MEIGAVHVHDVKADDLRVHWLRPNDPDDTKVSVVLNGARSESIALFFEDRGEAARFADRLVELVAMLPDKDLHGTPEGDA